MQNRQEKPTLVDLGMQNTSSANHAFILEAN